MSTGKLLLILLLLPICGIGWLALLSHLSEAYVRGYVHDRLARIYKKDQPFSFWSGIALRVLIGVFLTAALLIQIFKLQ